ncbi:MAG: LysM peptidoglycan-binding domain-containing protein [Pseudomonadota bacterium]
MSTDFNRTVFLTGIILLLSGCATTNTDTHRQEPSRPAVSTSATDLGHLAAPASGHPASRSGQPTSATQSTAPDFWQQVRNDFRLPGKQQAAVKRRAAIYGNNASQVERIFKRGEPYLAYIQNEVHKRGFPAEITLLPFVESGYDPFAYSRGRAAGLWQFIPGTGKMYGLTQDWWYDGRRDVIASTQAALNYLDWLQKKFDGDWLLALAAYNSGSGTVRKAIKKNRKTGRPTDFWNLRLPKETAAYVPKLLAISEVVARPRNYGVTLAAVNTTPDFTVVVTGGQLDIGVAADLANMEVDELYQLNPAFNRWATHPDGPHQLVLPAAKATVFENNLATLPESQRMKWVRHRIRNGETLSHIARKYDTTVAVVRQTNQLHSSNIRAGKYLLVPVAAQDASRYAALDRFRGRRKPAGTTSTYKVKSGDSLWNIARSNSVTVSQITRWNDLNSNTVIKPGQKLVIRKGSTVSTGSNQFRTIRYTVRKGDSLFRISRKFNVSIADLRSWNNLTGKKYLQPGQRLKVHVDVTQQSVARRG